MIKVISVLYDGMQACVQVDYGNFSAWLNVCQGFRQGCVLSPLFFNIFAAAIRVFPQGFAVDSVIVSDWCTSKMR